MSAATRLGRPAIRVRPAPPLEPPFDDEAPPQAWAGPGAEQLALDLRATPVTRPMPVATAVPARARVRASAESWGAVRGFLRLCLEVFNGYRPAGHVRSLTFPPQAATVIEQLVLARERVTALVTSAAGQSPGSAPARRRAPVGLRRLHVCEPRAGVAEAAAVLGTAGRTWAVAVRLELRRGRWLCTAARTV
jgi:hypothetical protein